MVVEKTAVHNGGMRKYMASFFYFFMFFMRQRMCTHHCPSLDFIMRWKELFLYFCQNCSNVFSPQVDKAVTTHARKQRRQILEKEIKDLKLESKRAENEMLALKNRQTGIVA